MKGDGRSRSIELKAILVVVILMAILAIIKIQSEPGDASIVQIPSTFYNSRYGARALYLALEELEIPAGRWMRPLGEAKERKLPEPRVLAIISPSEPLTPPEARWLEDWVRRGGRLLYVPAGERHGDALLELLGLDPVGSPSLFPIQGSGGENGEESSVQKDTSGRLGDPLTGEALDLLEETPDAITGFSRLLQIGERPAGRMEVLYSREDRFAAALLHPGEGKLAILSHPGPITNHRIRESGAVSLVIRTLALLSGGETVWFDEYHHGFDDRGGIVRTAWRFLTREPAGWAILAMAFLGLGAIFFAGIRMGSPLPPEPRLRRSSLEHVEALAAGYLSARALARPAELLLEGLRVKLGARDREDFKMRLSGIALTHPQLRKTVEEIEMWTNRPKPPTDTGLVRLSRSIDRILRALGLSEVQGHSQPTSLMEEIRAGRD